MSSVRRGSSPAARSRSASATQGPHRGSRYRRQQRLRHSARQLRGDFSRRQGRADRHGRGSRRPAVSAGEGRADTAARIRPVGLRDAPPERGARPRQRPGISRLAGCRGAAPVRPLRQLLNDDAGSGHCAARSLLRASPRCPAMAARATHASRATPGPTHTPGTRRAAGSRAPPAPAAARVRVQAPHRSRADRDSARAPAR
jgi:hypothetical protein